MAVAVILVRGDSGSEGGESLLGCGIIFKDKTDLMSQRVQIPGAGRAQEGPVWEESGGGVSGGCGEWVVSVRHPAGTSHRQVDA